jgi:hypothetical protein
MQQGGYTVIKGKFLKQASFIVSALTVMFSSSAKADIDPTLPNLVTVPVNFAVTVSAFRCGGLKTLEFESLTANIGAQDWVRPRSTGFILRQIYEYTLAQLQQVGTDPDTGDPIFDYVRTYQGRKNTLCIQDDFSRGNMFPCLQGHDWYFNCGSTYGHQGVSVGWADSYYRGLPGQFACLGSLTGSFRLTIELDPDRELDPGDSTLLDAEKDATHDDNVVNVYFDYDGTPSGFNITSIAYGGGFDPAAVCP